MEDRAILPGASPLLKTPEYVDMYGVNQPFQTRSFKTTSETESNSFEKTSSSGSVSIAVSSSSSKHASASASGWGMEGEVSGSKSESNSNETGMSHENRSESETKKKTSTAFMFEYVMMPMRSFRVPYTSMRLSEDAKDSIMKVTTERRAKEFLITYGTHIPCGLQTLGGVFIRKIFMQTDEQVTSTAIYASAGFTMTSERSKTVSGEASASGSKFGVTVSASAGFENSSKSGVSMVSNTSSESGKKDAETKAFYTMTISSLGPNATTTAAFYEKLSTNTGSWAIIDRGNLDQVRPVWELVQDEMLGGEISTNRESRSKEEVQIRRAISLMRSVW